MAETAARKIRVSDHAVDQYRLRLLPKDKRNKTIRNTIAELVSEGIENGNVRDSKPNRFLLYGQRAGKLPPYQYVVWCDREPRAGFLVLRDPNERNDYVKTTLIRVRAKK